jgi:hypothetical protein
LPPPGTSPPARNRMAQSATPAAAAGPITAAASRGRGD